MEMVMPLSFIFYGNLTLIKVKSGFLFYYIYPKLQAYAPEIMECQM